MPDATNSDASARAHFHAVALRTAADDLFPLAKQLADALAKLPALMKAAVEATEQASTAARPRTVN